uniref:ABC3 transporter permease C-terminal domain-containing protein n=1 Tax=Guillardia theta TaxID=55529 RepID=A0A6U6A8Q8_GUITH|mmetsp:Transcript_30059/g.96601  ORF Transcript_30059/g.96601 Transcript_30059/m.96601 type:complete len:1150 (+) Transcript_30059:202-3651(+)
MTSITSKKASHSHTVSSLVSLLLLAFNFVHSQARKDKRRACIGVLTVLLVVTFIGFVYNVILRSPVIFLKLAETQVGETDMVIFPSLNRLDPLLNLDKQMEQVDVYPFFNASQVRDTLSDIPQVFGVSPRWIVRGSIASSREPSKRVVTYILVCDLEEEERMGVGRAWPYRRLGALEAHVTASVLKSLKVRPNRGDRVLIDMGMQKLLNSFGVNADALKQLLFRSVLEDGVTVRLNGTMIRLYLEEQGFLVPPGLISDTIVTRQPVSSLVNVDRLIEASIEGVKRGELMNLDVSVADAIENSYEKWPPIGNIVLLEAKYFLQAVKASMNQVPLVQMLNLGVLVNRTGNVEEALLLTETPLTDEWLNFNLMDYAFLVLVQYRDRYIAYLKSEAGRLSDMVKFSNEVGEKLGFTSNLSITLPIATALQPLMFLRVFLQQIFNAVVAVLVVHGCITVYSLLLTDVNARTYEYGMLRVMGLTKTSLLTLLLVQALYYAVPGLLLGLLLSWAASFPAIDAISKYALVSLDYNLEAMALTSAIAIGIAMPLAGNIFPIKRALSRTLAESLDVYHKTHAETIVHFQRLADLGLSPSQTFGAVGMVVTGVLIYYVIPLSFLLQNFSLLLSSLNFILLGTVAGLILLSVLLQPTGEWLVAQLIMQGEDRRFLDIVLKNLTSHRQRSMKTSLIFCSTLAFIVFAGSMFSLQAHSIIGNIKVALGSDIRIESSQGPLKESNLSSFLLRERLRPDSCVLDFAWASWPLWNVDPPVSRVIMGNMVGFPQGFNAETVAISDNYLDVTYSEFFVPLSADGCSRQDCSRGLDFTVNPNRNEDQLEVNVLSGAQHACERVPSSCRPLESSRARTRPRVRGILPASLATSIGAEVKSLLVLVLIAQNEREYSPSRFRRNIFIELEPKVLAKKFPGFFFSSYEAATSVSDPPLLVNEDTWQKLFDLAVEASNLNATRLGLPKRPPKRTLHIRLKETADEQERVDLINSLRPYLEESTSISDTLQLVEVTSGTVNMMMLFFYLIAFIASVLCFFMLFITFEANVRENLWEFGVLRALGISANELARIFVYESLSMIISAIAMGSTIGLVVSSTLTLQQNLFTEMPFLLIFPYWLFISVIVLSLLVAAFGALLPVRKMLRCSISEVLKKT